MCSTRFCAITTSRGYRRGGCSRKSCSRRKRAMRSRSDRPPMKRIVLLRHGESVWNQQNRFTGWTDVGLSEKGVDEAKAAAKLLRREGYEFDLAFTSVLKRAIKTLWIVLEDMDRMWIPAQNSWR